MWSTELQEILILLIIPEVLTFRCPDVTSCECRKKQKKTDNKEVSSSIVECRGDLPLNELNSTNLQNIEITQLILNNVTLDTKMLEKDLFSGLKVNTLKIKKSKFPFQNDSLILLKPTLRQLVLYDVGIHFQAEKKLPFLQGFSNLETLQMDKNGEFPVHFPSHFFTNLSLISLKKLTLRNCEIAKIYGAAFDGLPNLEVLDLSYNKLSSVPRAILLLKNLRKLILSYNSVLYYLHDNAFVSLNKLEEIDISHTKLHTVAPEAFYGLEKSLKWLKLDHGDLPYGPFSSLKNLHELRILDISYNKIVEMHNTSFEGFHSLEELDISGQFDTANLQRSFTFVDSMFRGVETKLKVLKIRNLGLEELPLAALSMLRNVRVLDASENDFVEIYESFFDHISAKTIILTDMRINEISDEAFGTLRGVNIIFDRNNITNISFINEVAPCSFDKLSFIGNPIICDCDVVEIVYTNRVRELVGACANEEFRRVNLQKLPESDKAVEACDTSDLEKIEYCTYMNVNTAAAMTSITAVVSLLPMITVIIRLQDGVVPS